MHLEGTPLFPTVAAPGHWPIRGWLFPEAERGLCSGSCPSLLSQASPAPCPLPAPLSTLPIKGSLPHEDSREPAPPWARALSGSAAPTQHPQGPMPSPQDQAGPWQSRGLVRVASSQPWGSDPSTPEQVSYSAAAHQVTPVLRTHSHLGRSSAKCPAGLGRGGFTLDQLHLQPIQPHTHMHTLPPCPQRPQFGRLRCLPHLRC